MRVIITDHRYPGFNAEVIDSVIDVSTGKVILVLKLSDGTLIQEPLNKVKADTRSLTESEKLDVIIDLLKSIKNN